MSVVAGIGVTSVGFSDVCSSGDCYLVVGAGWPVGLAYTLLNVPHLQKRSGRGLASRSSLYSFKWPPLTKAQLRP